MIDHISTSFSGLQSEVASTRANDGGDKSHNPPKGPGLVKGQSNKSSARCDNSNVSRPLTQFRVLIDQRPCFRHPLNQGIGLVAATYGTRGDDIIRQLVVRLASTQLTSAIGSNN